MQNYYYLKKEKVQTYTMCLLLSNRSAIVIEENANVRTQTQYRNV